MSALFPDLGIWNCSQDGLLDAPAMVLSAALYLTATSTTTVSDDDNASGLFPQATSRSGLPGPISQAGAVAVAPTAQTPPNGGVTALTT